MDNANGMLLSEAKDNGEKLAPDTKFLCEFVGSPNLALSRPVNNTIKHITHNIYKKQGFF